MSEQAANRRRQEELYGEPLASLVAGICDTLGINQTAVARVLGLSTPMLSHLVAGRRVKIGSPLAHARLVQLRRLAADVAAGRTSPAQAAEEVARIAASQDSWATTAPTTEPAALQQQLLSVAPAEEWVQIAAEIAERHPGAAALLHQLAAGRAQGGDVDRVG
ncbi:DNA-binding protein [Auraticoccus sp. F435]|uniref:DNA-binding protein n=1 Tax=Auraticoccus cholistanensis TaxID=2656650 RepID=A0A6A9V228_9ACTN|nr:DNA-binding protein [Auraticoccus cholistanensis]MVA77652.1 DNA-binding protein [Auraticoccus cholistanensis]